MQKPIAFCLCLTIGVAACGPDTTGPIVENFDDAHIAVLSGATPITSGQATAIAFPEARRYGDAPVLELSLRNAGAMALEIGGIQVPANVSASLTGPLTIDPGQQRSLTLTLPTDERLTVTGDVVISSNDPGAASFRVPIVGEVEPYVAVRRAAHPEADTYLQSAMSGDGLVGLGAAVIRGQNIVYLEGFGFEDREAAIPVDPQQTRFRWASSSKSVTGLATFIAAKEARVDLDRSVSDYVTEYAVPSTYAPQGCTSDACTLPIPPADRVITARQLVGHSAGIRHYHNGFGELIPPTSLTDDPAVNTGIWWAIDITWKDSPLVNIPGQAHNYSTFGYNLLAVVLERATNMSFASWVDSRISEPLGMTTFRPDYLWDNIPSRAAGYRLEGGVAVRDGDNDVTWKLGGGGFVSTVEDFARYCGGLLGDVVVSTTERDQQLWQPLAPPWPELGTVDPALLGYGFGAFIESDVIWHTGGQQKAATAFRIRPDENLCFVVMSNSIWADPQSIVEGLDGVFVR